MLNLVKFLQIVFSHIVFKSFQYMPGEGAAGHQECLQGKWPYQHRAPCLSQLLHKHHQRSLKDEHRRLSPFPSLWLIRTGGFLLEYTQAFTLLIHSLVRSHRAVKYYLELHISPMSIPRFSGQLWGDQLAQGFMQSGLENVRGWRLHSLSRQTILVSSGVFGEKKLYVLSDPLFFQFMPSVSFCHHTPLWRAWLSSVGTSRLLFVHPKTAFSPGWTKPSSLSLSSKDKCTSPNRLGGLFWMCRTCSPLMVGSPVLCSSLMRFLGSSDCHYSLPGLYVYFD